jgi:hypothetical protein
VQDVVDEPHTIGRMSPIVWMALGMASVAALVALGLLQRSWRTHASSRFDVGPVSEAWLAEQSGRRNS